MSQKQYGILQVACNFLSRKVTGLQYILQYNNFLSLPEKFHQKSPCILMLVGEVVRRSLSSLTNHEVCLVTCVVF